jgi:hypothetical protein
MSNLDPGDADQSGDRTYELDTPSNQTPDGLHVEIDVTPITGIQFNSINNSINNSDFRHSRFEALKASNTVEDYRRRP